MSNLFIPFCIIEDILIRLPGRSIARFKCVCKSWQSFLTSPSFAAINFKNSMENCNPNVKVIFCTRDSKFSYFDEENSKAVPMLLPSKIRYSYSRHYVKILGSCNGFLCISPEQTSDVYVWNPHTSEYRIVHVPEGEIVGFGYNASSCDYEVLTVRTSEDGSQVNVFSLRSKSCKKLGKIPYVLHSGDRKRGIFVNGALHWIASTVCRKKVVLLAYDINAEKFREVPIPNEKAEFVNKMRSYSAAMKVSVLQDYLCVSFFECGRSEFWAMANYGEKESWTMYNFINHGAARQYNYDNNVRQLCLMSKGKEFLLVGETHSLVNRQGYYWEYGLNIRQRYYWEYRLDIYLYDRENQCYKNFGKKGMSGKSFDAITYEETNISLSS